MTSTLDSREPSIYRIRVKGTLDPSWTAWFDGMAVEATSGGETVLSGPVRDQSALYGLLGKVRDMGLSLLSVEQLKHVDGGAGENRRWPL